MASHLASAAVSLHLFDQEYARRAEFATVTGSLEQRSAEEAEALGELLGELDAGRTTPPSLQERAPASVALREQAAQRAAQKRWKAGVWPDTYLHQAQFAHAMAFVQVLNVFVSCSDSWSRNGGTRDQP
jgi:hypothetical protein